MSLMMNSAKSSFEFNESSLFSRSRTSSLSINDAPHPSSHSIQPFFIQQCDKLTSHLDELENSINIYHEDRGHLEEDKKSRTELNTEILKDDLYCPVQQQDVKNNNTTSRGLNIVTSFLPRFFPTTFSTNNSYSGALESTKNADTWDYFNHNDMFNTTSMFCSFDGINGINSVACQ